MIDVKRLAEKIYNALYHLMVEPWDDDDRTEVESLLSEAMGRDMWWKSCYEDGRKSGLAEAAEVARNWGTDPEAGAMIAAAIEKLREEKS